MTFSYKIKEELYKIENKNQCCERAECYGALLFLKFFSSKKEVIIGNTLVARKVSEMITALTASITEIRIHYTKKAYTLNLPDEYDRAFVLKFFGCEGVNLENIQNKCCQKAFLRGVFMACGIVSDPQKQYKLELVVADENLAEFLKDYILKNLFLEMNISKRRESFVVYSKNSSKIEDFLIAIGAKNSSMSLMQEKMFKEEMNNINRKSNCETANIDRVAVASAKQIAAIALLHSCDELDNLAQDLGEIAQFRLENPQMSLSQIANELNISRSAVNHKFNKIINIAQKIKKE